MHDLPFTIDGEVHSKVPNVTRHFETVVKVNDNIEVLFVSELPHYSYFLHASVRPVPRWPGFNNKCKSLVHV